MKILTAIPVYNEECHLEKVLREVRRYSPDILVVNDGSTDQTAELLAVLSCETAFHRDLQSRSSLVRAPEQHGVSVQVITHPHNRGYGAALISAFAYALDRNIDVLVTMDCDGQHEPARIPVLLEAIDDADIVSGSRYLRSFRDDGEPPADRLHINQQITAELNCRFGLKLTDSFCGFKAYRAEALARLRITETGWGMPLQLWVQAAHLGLRIKEVAVPRVYLDPTRAFGGVLNDAGQRLAYYQRVIDAAAEDEVPESSIEHRALPAGCCRSAPFDLRPSILNPRSFRERCW